MTGSIPGGFLRITLVYNEGGVFGILQGYKNMFLVVSLLVLTVMVGYYAYEYIYRKNRSMIFSAAMALIVSGAIGNIIDRLISHRPGVVDFISIGVDGVYRWPTFNVPIPASWREPSSHNRFLQEEKRHREVKEAEQNSRYGHFDTPLRWLSSRRRIETGLLSDGQTAYWSTTTSFSVASTVSADFTCIS